MTDLEFQYVERAVEALKSADTTEMDRAKILQTVSEITARAALQIRAKLIDKVDAAMSRL